MPLTQQPTSTQNSALDLLGLDHLKAICADNGPFVTVFLPASHPGSADLPHTGRMKTILREAAAEIEQRRFTDPIEQLLKPLEKLAGDPAMLSGGSDSVMYVSPNTAHHFRLLSPMREQLTVASHPHITPALGHLIPDKEVYVLAISKKLLRLGRWENGVCAEVPLPAGIVKSFEESLLLDQPDHDLQNRASSGPAGQHGVAVARFGTGAERELEHERLRQYLRRADRELCKVLKGAPLVLVSVAEEMAAYQSVTEHARVLSAHPTSPELLKWTQLGKLLEQAVLADRKEQANKVLIEIRETTRRDHVVNGVRQVLEAAHEGRVHKLLIGMDAEEQGLLGPSFPVDASRLEGKQDLINAAAVETIRMGGEVFVLDGQPLRAMGCAAILRY